MALNWARQPAPSRYRGEAVVVIEGYVDQAVIRENEPPGTAAAAIAVEIGLAENAARHIRQLPAEIPHCVAPDDLARPYFAQAAAAPAARSRRVFRHIARRQALRAAQALYRVDKSFDVPQSDALGKSAEVLRLGR